MSEKTTEVIAWMFFPNLLPTYYIKEMLLSLAPAVEVPIHLDIRTINKTRLSYANKKSFGSFNV